MTNCIFFGILIATHMNTEQKLQKNFIENKNVFQAEAFFLDLSKKMYDQTFIAENPVLNPEISSSSLKKIVGEYSGLIYAIVGFLSKARYRLKGDSDIASELDNNISEERGSRTQGISHQALFSGGVLREKGIALSEMPWGETTLNFLNRIDDVLSKGSRSQVAGVAYALEATAVPELQVIEKIFSKIPSVRTPADLQTGLDTFISMHINDFEPGHRDRLAVALSKYLENNTFDPRAFQQAFQMVLDAMDLWWAQLAKVEA